jgi:hypothetical protein
MATWIWLAGCGIQNIEFEYAANDPMSPDFNPRQPVITGSGIHARSNPFIEFRIGTRFSGGTLIEKSLTEDPLFFPIDTVVTNETRYIDYTGQYSRWLQYRVSTVNRRPEMEFLEEQSRAVPIGNLIITSRNPPADAPVNFENTLTVFHRVLLDYRLPGEDTWTDPAELFPGTSRIFPQPPGPPQTVLLRLRAITHSSEPKHTIAADSIWYEKTSF